MAQLSSFVVVVLVLFLFVSSSSHARTYGSFSKVPGQRNDVSNLQASEVSHYVNSQDNDQEFSLNNESPLHGLDSRTPPSPPPPLPVTTPGLPDNYNYNSYVTHAQEQINTNPFFNPNQDNENNEEEEEKAKFRAYENNHKYNDKLGVNNPSSPPAYTSPSVGTPFTGHPYKNRVNFDHEQSQFEQTQKYDEQSDKEEDSSQRKPNTMEPRDEEMYERYNRVFAENNHMPVSTGPIRGNSFTGKAYNYNDNYNYNADQKQNTKEEYYSTKTNNEDTQSKHHVQDNNNENTPPPPPPNRMVVQNAFTGTLEFDVPNINGQQAEKENENAATSFDEEMYDPEDVHDQEP